MSKNRRKRRVYIDAGDGITIATSVRGPLDPETEAAFVALARAAAAKMGSGTTTAGHPLSPESASASSSESSGRPAGRETE